jgi:hypothetical protein
VRRVLLALPHPQDDDVPPTNAKWLLDMVALYGKYHKVGGHHRLPA